MFEWNPVFGFVMDLKRRYQKQFREAEYKKYAEGEKEISCLEYWAKMLCDASALEKLNYLKVTQENELISIHYVNYYIFADEDTAIRFDELWDAFDGFYLECRGLVIDLKEECIVLSPFKKFRNLNEEGCQENKTEVILEEIKNASSVEITNKLDGSMQSARWYQGKAILSGSRSLNPKNSFQLAEGYKMLNTNENLLTMLKENPDETFIFEFISLEDAHVVKYTKEQEGQYLIGIRNVYTGEQYSYKKVAEYAEKYHVPMTQVFDKSFEEILEEIQTLKSDEQEGFVVNIDGHMVKVKAEDYVKIHKILSKISSANVIIEYVAENKIQELLAKVPEAYHSRIEAVRKVVDNYVETTKAKILEYYEKAPKAEKKEFMLWVEANVPKEYKGYVRNEYLGKKYNLLKMGSSKCPSYRKLKDMGVEDSQVIFDEAP